MMSNKQKQKFKENAELDMAYGVAGLGRFRCNFFQQRGSIAIVLRVIPTHIFSIEELNLPKVLENSLSRTAGPCPGDWNHRKRKVNDSRRHH